MAQYSGPVIDTHHHIWLRKDIPWLADPPIPRMFGEYFGLRRDYPVEEWINDVAPRGGDQVGARHRDVGQQARARRDPLAAIGRRQARFSARHRLSGRDDRSRSRREAEGADAVRQFARRAPPMLHWDSHPLRQPKPTPDLCNTPEFRRGFALLEKYGLHFELQVFAGQAKYAVELIKAFPKVPMILLHSGMLTDRAPLMIEQWRAALTAMAAFPNVHVKLSGLGMFNQGITLAAGAPGDPRLRSRFSASSAQFTAAISRWRNCTPATPISSPSIAKSCRNTPRPTSAKCFTTTR